MEGVDPDSAAYHFGEFMAYSGMVGVALGLLLWGFVQRTGPKRNAGQIKMAIGAGLACLALLSGLLRVVAPGDSSSDTERVSAQRQSMINAAADYLESRRYVRVRGVTTDGGRLDITYVGDESTGSMQLADNGGSVHLRRASGRTFIKPSKQFWESQAGDKDPTPLIDYLDGRWLELRKGDDGFEDLASTTRRGWLLDNLAKPVRYRRSAPKTIRGVECIAVKGGALGGIFYLARDDFRLLRFIDTVGEVDDIFYDRPVADPAPPKDAVAASEISG